MIVTCRLASLPVAASVFRAREHRHGRDVALKVLLPEIASAVGAGRFLREIGIAARLQHPQIVPVFDSGEHEGQLFYVMPLIDGHSLAEQLRRSGRLPVDEALAILAELEGRWKADPTCTSAIATRHLHLGDRAGFYRWMEQALEDREPFCVALYVERLWESAWDDAEYRALVRKVGLVA